MTKNVLQVYTNNINRFTKLTNSLKKKNNRYIFQRLLFFGISVLFLVLMIKNGFSLAFLITIIASFMAFLLVVRLSIKNNEKIRFYNRLIKINQDETKALNHDFSSFETGDTYIDPQHQFSYDLDLFGEGSIFQQLNRCSSETGSQELANWLNNPLQDKKDIMQRQKAVLDLAEMVDFRQEFIALLPENIDTEKKRKQIINWANEVISEKNFHFFKYISTSFSIISSVLLILVFIGLIPASFIFLMLVVNASLIFSKIKLVNKEHGQISRQFETISNFAGQIKHLEEIKFEADALIGLQKKILGDDMSGSKSLKQLAAIISSFDYRLNFIVSIVLNGFFFWDFFCMVRLYKWKTVHAKQLKQWFETLDEFDAFQSIANFRFNNPGYTFADFLENDTVISATQLGHPQINPAKRVCNDLKIEHKGTFLIITGPNMAGKSTFLRTVGEAIVLSQCGAPVCAEKIDMIPVTLFSSMRTSDSLHKNESYFYAELKRLQYINKSIENHNNVFIILDEILKGTNSIDKANGSNAFLKNIVNKGATGIVATHDLSLGELENEETGCIFNYCFEADTEDDLLSFNYSLKRGVTTKMNATALMKKMKII